MSETKIPRRASKPWRHSGFTLVELMAVVAIISILAVIALPAFLDFAVRSKVSEGMSFAAEAKTAVTEYYYSTRTMPTSNAQAGLPLASNYSRYDHLERLSLSSSDPGVITVTFSLGGSRADGTALQLVPNTSGPVVAWTCIPDPLNPIGRNLVPPNCRN